MVQYDRLILDTAIFALEIWECGIITAQLMSCRKAKVDWGPHFFNEQRVVILIDYFFQPLWVCSLV